MAATYQDVLDGAEEMERVQAALVLEHGEFPGPSALCKSFDRAPVRICRELLQLSPELLDHSGHAAIDATYFDRDQPTRHYSTRTHYCVWALKVTVLVDVETLYITDIR